MNVTLFFSLLVVLGFFSVWIGNRAGKGLKSTEDYFLAGRKLALFPLAMTLLATQLGGGALMGAAEEAYTRGWIVIFYPLGMVLGLIILGIGFGAKMRKLELTTVAEIFEKIYKSPFLRKCASLLSIASLFFILVGQAIAARKFFISLGFEINTSTLIFTLFWVVVVVYTVFGGLKGVVNTDILQALFMLGALGFSFCAVYFVSTPTMPAISVANPSSVSSNVPWLSWLILPLFFMLIEQDMGQRCFAAKRPRIVSLASLTAAFLLLCACVCPIYLGCKAKMCGIEINGGESVLLAAVKGLTSPTVATFLILAVLMALVSTIDSLLNSISSNLVFDFPKFREKGIGLSRIVTTIVGGLTFALSFLFDNVLSMLIFSYDLAVSVLFVPIILALFLKRPSQRSALISMIVGSCAFLLFRGVAYKELWTLATTLLSFGLSEGWIRMTSLEKKLVKENE